MGLTLDEAMGEAEGPLQQESSHPGSLEDWLPLSEESALQLHAVSGLMHWVSREASLL